MGKRIDGEYEALDEYMVAYLKLVKQYLIAFEWTQIIQVSKDKNEDIDILEYLAHLLTKNHVDKSLWNICLTPLRMFKVIVSYWCILYTLTCHFTI